MTVTRAVTRSPARSVCRTVYRSTPGAFDFTKAALLGDSFLAYTYDTLSYDGISDALSSDGATLTIDGSGSSVVHRLLEGGRVWGFDVTTPANVLESTVTAWTSANYAQASTAIPASAGAGTLLNLQRFNDYGSWVPYWLGMTGHLVDVVPACLGGALAADYAGWAAHIPSDTGWVFASVGYNDATGADSAATIWANIEAAVDAQLVAGRKVVLQTIPPYSAAGAIRTKIEAINASILAKSHPGLFVLDAYAELDDGAGGQGANMFMADLIHPSPLGAYAVAVAANTLLSGQFTARDILPQTGAETNGIVANPLFSGTAGTTSGTGITNPGGTGVADNWTVVGSAAAVLGTCAKETRGDGFGSNQNVTGVTFTAAAQSLLIRAASAHASYTAGDTVYGVAEITIEGMSAMRRLRLTINVTDADATLNLAASWCDAPDSHATALVQQGNRTVTVRTPNITLTNTPSNMQLVAAVVASDAMSGGTIKVGRAEIFKVA